MPAPPATLFLQAARAGQADVPVILGLAYACRALQDWAGGRLVDRVLTLDPRNVRALVMKGDGFEQAGNTRAASAYYRAALRSAPPPDRVSPDLLQELRRVQQASEKYEKRYEEHMRTWLKSHGFDESESNTRVRQSLDIMLGRKRIHLQEPRHFYFPQLPQRQFYDRADFPWLDAIEAATDSIRAEWQAIRQGTSFKPYRRARPGGANCVSAFLLAERRTEPRPCRPLPADDGCLGQRATVAQIPHFAFGAVRALAAGTHMPPRSGPTNTRLQVHLPLIAPSKCRLRVGNDVREWQAGRASVFDDSMDHEAWNDGDQALVVLQFDIARPEMTEDENRL
ncbi:MAG: aspartyl/asparaginyl beta-hydroxylase domain-containing protein [Proteobacteria bacterium]|nr:aspartyl/asparaginyl beta-hydroxylase domain-containing protein [Pseudomonadota bacterium]